MEGEKLVHSAGNQFRGEKIVRDLRGGGVGEHLFIKQVFSLEEKGLYGILGVEGERKKFIQQVFSLYKEKRFKGILGVEGEKLIHSASSMFIAERIVR